MEEECDDENGNQWVNTQLYVAMRADNDIRRRQKLNSMRRPKSRKQPEIYSVVSCVVTIRPVVLFEPKRSTISMCPGIRHGRKLTGFFIMSPCEGWL